jgi:FtsP/CotA-like multicopper oxidase with cupredoxin domain
MHVLQSGLVALALAATSYPFTYQTPSGAGSSPAQLAPVVPNDNRRAAGNLMNDVLTLDLRAGEGMWKPQGERGPAFRVGAFGETHGPLTTPAPLIRVPEGTEIHASVRNDLSLPLRVHGLCTRPATMCTPLDVPPGESREVRFGSGPAGTYHYWATTMGMPPPFRAADDTQFSGGFIVDAAGTAPETDRLFVITDWTSVTREQLKRIAAEADPGRAFLALNPDVMFLVNGLAWPHTERLTYGLASPVRWRVINLSSQVHPMHLHGFYFEVDSLGDGVRDKIFGPGLKQRVVTQVMQPGSTMAMTWKPERAGNWLFHCHVMQHVSPTLSVDGSMRPSNGHQTEHVGAVGMTGLVLGVTIIGPQSVRAAEIPARAPRKLTLLMQSEPRRFGDAPAFGFVLADGNNESSPGRVPVPGPTLVLKRGEPVEITLVNRLPEGTAIHWHGMELESCYDGVHGFSGIGQRVTPLIESGGSFVVRFTPPRTGTFMYHTHLHDNTQLTSGLYGAMLVVEPGEALDEATDHVFVMGRGGPDMNAPTLLNGKREPQFVWKAGVKHRIRLINITPNDIFAVSLHATNGPVQWRPLTKDGAPLPADRCQSGPAQVVIGVGETYDFEYSAPAVGRRCGSR